MSYFFKETQYEKTKGMCSNCWTLEYHDYVLEVRTVSVGKCFPPEQLFNVVGVSAGGVGYFKVYGLSTEENSLAQGLRVNAWERL